MENLQINNRLQVEARKDVMKMPSRPKDNSQTVANDWQNEKNLEGYSHNDAYSRRSKRSKHSRIGSRDGSRKSRRHKASAFSTSRKHHNKSRAHKRVLHHNKAHVCFGEFKNEDRINHEMGVDHVNKSQSERPIDPRMGEVKYDESELDDAVSYRYSLADRSYSFEQEEDVPDEDPMNVPNQGDENFLEIVEKDQFEKLENYRDR